MRAILGRLLVCLSMSMPCAAFATSDPVVTLAAGALRGTARPDGGVAFKGVRYAAPPVGALRWMPPAPARPWRGVQAATAFGHPCVQTDQKWNTKWATIGDEDCLYLNIWTPKLPPTARMPVMVWIHGGGFTGGAGDAADADGARLAAQGVVVVTLNYRLGVMGFFAHPQASGNFGLLDQLEALRWVQANIGRFGGDPQAITIFGQSAGGASVESLLASPRTKGLVKNAIIESGIVVPLFPTLSLAQARDSALRFSGGRTVEQLRALPAADIIRQVTDFTPKNPTDTRDMFISFVDGAVLPDDPQAIFAQGGELKVPLLIGNNAQEGVLFGPMSDAKLAETLRRAYGDKAEAAVHVYGVDASPAADPVLGSAAMTWATDTVFRCGASRIARRHAATGAATYEYQFEQPLPGHDGTLHSDEIPYVFGNLIPEKAKDGIFPPGHRALSDVMIRYWSNFAKHGDPNGAGLPRWPAFDGDQAFVRLSTHYPSSVRADTSLRRSACELYEASPAFREH